MINIIIILLKIIKNFFANRIVFTTNYIDFNISDAIQVAMVIVTALAIVVPVIVEKRNKEKQFEEKEKRKPKIKLVINPDSEDLFTTCLLNNGHDAKSLKIRVNNEGFTTAKNVQIKITDFDKTAGLPKITILPYSFLKLNWSYQDQRRILGLPPETKMDIQIQSYEDCDFIFIDLITNKGFLVSDQLNYTFPSTNGVYRVYFLVSGDNIDSEKFSLIFRCYNNKITVIKDFDKE